MATTRVFYKGKKELTMAQFEALTSLDDAVDYNITDFPNGGITNAQMTAALGYLRLFVDGDVFVCLDNGTYTKGHTYQVKVTNGVKSWEDITPESAPSTGTDIQVTELPPASAENAGKIVQFIATTAEMIATDSEQTQGHWYKCKSVVAEEGRYEWVKQEVQDKDYIINTSSDYTSYPENVGRMVYRDPLRKLYWIPYIALGELDQLLNYTQDITINYTVDSYGELTNKSQTMTYSAEKGYWETDTSGGFFLVCKVSNIFETELSNLFVAVYQGNDLTKTTQKITVTSIVLANGTSIAIPTGYGEAKFYDYSINNAYSSPIDFSSKFESGNLTNADIEAFRFMAVNSVDVTFDINKLQVDTENGLKPLKDYLGGSSLYKHELVIPYSFSVGNSETVNGSVTYHYLSNTGTQITSASEIDDNFMLSGGIGKNSVALTWTIKQSPQVTTAFETAINFTSNGEAFDKIQLGHGDPPYDFYSKITYVNSTASTDKVVFNGSNAWTSYGEEYRTITFETAPSGELLTWLQANAVPQGGESLTTVLLLNVNVTKAGTSITVEAVNAATSGYITGTVGTITDTVTQLI